MNAAIETFSYGSYISTWSNYNCLFLEIFKMYEARLVTLADLLLMFIYIGNRISEVLLGVRQLE